VARSQYIARQVASLLRFAKEPKARVPPLEHPNSSLSPLLYNLAGTESRLLRFARVSERENIVIGRWYFLRQAAATLEFAQSTNDPKLAAVLVEKAANLLAQIDEADAGPHPSPLAPDIQPEM
jgi:hypothetical protein